jgi:uncharacterized protein YegL
MSIETAGNAVLPFYILCDESGSMDANGGIDAINSGLPELHAAIAGDPLVSDKARIGLLTFSDMAEELLPLSNLSDVQAMPGCQAKGMTNYGEAFNLLRVVIQRDVSNLKSQGFQVFRPAVFFITDGEPTDDWEANHHALTNKVTNPQAPHIIAFGVAGANPSVIGKVGTKAAFIANQGTDPGNALKEILRSLTNSIINSSSSSTPTLHVPTAPPGTTAVPLDVL